MAECLIGGIHIDTSTAEGQNIYVGLPNGVTLQQSLMEDVESIYGVPKDRYEPIPLCSSRMSTGCTRRSRSASITKREFCIPRYAELYDHG